MFIKRRFLYLHPQLNHQDLNFLGSVGKYLHKTYFDAKHFMPINQNLLFCFLKHLKVVIKNNKKKFICVDVTY